MHFSPFSLHSSHFCLRSRRSLPPPASNRTEQIIGRWFAQGGGRREKVVIATKVYGDMGDWPNTSRLSALHIRQACEDSLRRLRTDHLDPQPSIPACFASVVAIRLSAHPRMVRLSITDREIAETIRVMDSSIAYTRLLTAAKACHGQWA